MDRTDFRRACAGTLNALFSGDGAQRPVHTMANAVWDAVLVAGALWAAWQLAALARKIKTRR